MLSSVKVQLVKIMDHIPGLRSRRNAMAEQSEFIAKDSFAHRYEDEKVLFDALVELGFKKEDIKIKVLQDFHEESAYPILG